MKKLVTGILTVAMVAAMSTTAFAAEITTGGGSDSKNVTGTYKASGEASTVYSVDVTWGSMEFTYNATTAGTWNPETHEYEGNALGGWTSDTGANKVTVTNHSNKAVTAGLTYEKGTSYEGISGDFDKASLPLATAEGTAVAAAPTASAVLTLSGELASSTAAKTVIGTVKVTLS